MQPFKDEDDIDLFVSPNQFSGRTPSAKSTRGRIFGDMLNEAKNLSDRQNVQFQPGGSKASAFALPSRRNTLFQDERDEGPTAPKGIAEQARIRGMISSVNLIAAAMGLVAMSVSGWLASRQGNPGLRALFEAELVFLQSPLYFAAVLFISGVCMVLFGAIIGAGSLSEGIASGYVLAEQRKLFLCYATLMFLSLIGMCFTAIASMSPLMTFKDQTNIDIGIWSTMSPSLVCEYEIGHGCGGLTTGSCTLKPTLTVVQTSTCPGLYCAKFCGGDTASGLPECSRCKKLGNAKVCRDHELNTNRQNGCGEGLLRESRFVWYLVLAVSVTGLFTIMGVAIIDIISAAG